MKKYWSRSNTYGYKVRGLIKYVKNKAALDPTSQYKL